jgi:hypothetical protein
MQVNDPLRSMTDAIGTTEKNIVPSCAGCSMMSQVYGSVPVRSMISTLNHDDLNDVQLEPFHVENRVVPCGCIAVTAPQDATNCGIAVDRFDTSRDIYKKYKDVGCITLFHLQRDDLPPLVPSDNLLPEQLARRAELLKKFINRTAAHTAMNAAVWGIMTAFEHLHGLKVFANYDQETGKHTFGFTMDEVDINMGPDDIEEPHSESVYGTCEQPAAEQAVAGEPSAQN